MHHSETAGPPEVVVARTHPPSRQRRRSAQSGESFSAPETGRWPATGRMIMFGLAGLLILLMGLYWAYNASHDGKVYGNVRVLSAELGGLAPQEALAALSEAGKDFPGRNIEVSAEGGKMWSLAPTDLGIGLDVDKTLTSAMSVGRRGGLDSAGTLFGKSEVAPAVKYDPSLVDAAVARISGELDRAPLDSKLERNEADELIVTPSAAGSAVDRTALRQAIVGSIEAQTFAPVSVSMEPVQPKITADALTGAHEQASRVTEQPVTLKHGKRVWTIETEDLRQMLSVSADSDGNQKAGLNEAALAEFLAPVAEEVLVEPTDAAVVLTKEKVTLREEEVGVSLDVPASSAAIQQAAQAASEEERSVKLVTNEVPASVHTEQVEPVYNRVSKLVTNGIRLWYGEDGYIVRNAALISFIDVVPEQGGPGKLKLVIDEDLLSRRIADIAENFNSNPVDARFRLVGGEPTRVTAGRNGVKVDVAATLDKAVKAINAYEGGDRVQIELVVKVTQPKVTNADIANINTPDLLGEGQTSYKGSSAERAANVELGAKKIDGTLVPPGGVFSTNDVVGPLTLDAGYKMGYMIVGDGDGGVTTVPAEAGGICQVSTTLFHAVFWGGLQVVERNWHSYWIASYGQAPSGLMGLDATIAPPYKDFRFKNNTGNWILIRASAANGTIRFRIHGIDPGWSVKVGDPVITNRVKTNTTPIEESSKHLPPGSRVKVENAQDGFSASISRVVRDAEGNVVDDWTAKSRYVPAKNRYLNGPAVAKPKTEEKPATEETPAATATPTP